MSNFLISEVHIENFRGYQKGDFSFFKDNKNKSGLILLGGANGFGKTSLLDAIEWCLSGNVRRLENEFKVRNKGEGANQFLQKGIVRNISGKLNTSVRIECFYKESPVTIERVFNGKNEKDIFEGHSQLTVKAEETVKESIEQVLVEISRTFYERYVCSYEKNLQIYQKGREDIYNMFASFFGSNQKIENILSNLEGNGEKGKKKIVGIIEQIEQSLETVVAKEEGLKELVVLEKNRLNDQENKFKEMIGYADEFKNYPPKLLYIGEKLPNEIEKMDSEYQQKQIYQQKQVLLTFLDIPLYDDIKLYTSFLELKIKLETFKQELLIPFRQKNKEILIAQKNDLKKIDEDKQRLEKCKRSISKLTNSRNFIRYVAILVQMPFFKKTEEKTQIIDSKIRETKELDKIVKDLLVKQGYFDNETPIVNALRALVDHKDGFIRHRSSGENQCPLCGSYEVYSSADLSVNARILLGKEDEKRAQLAKEIMDIKEKNSDLLNEIRSIINRQLDEIIKRLNYEKEINKSVESVKLSAAKHQFEFVDLNEEILLQYEEELIQRTNDLHKSLTTSEEDLISRLEDSNGFLRCINSLISPDKNASRTEFVQWSLEIKKNGFASFIQIHETEMGKIEDVIDFNQLDFESISVRISILTKLEKSIKELANLNGVRENHKKIVSDYNQVVKGKNQITDRITELKRLLSKTKELKSNKERLMTEQIIEPVNQIYRRINRHTNFKDICLNRTGITSQKSELIVIDTKGNESFISNIFSTGQLSTLAIAIFFATALRHSNMPFRCYFMDDPIQSMDDLNILSFVDLLRTELSISSSHERFFDQIFISTCDSDLENLIIHKMQSFGVNHCNLHFNGYGKYVEPALQKGRPSIKIENDQL